MSNDMTCKTCGGRGYLNPEAVTCPDCKGTGKQPKPTSPVTSTRAGEEMIQADSIASEKVCDHPSTEKAAIESECCREDTLAWEPCPPFQDLQAENAELRTVLKLARDRIAYYGFISARRHFDHDQVEIMPKLDAAISSGQVIAHPANLHGRSPESSEPSLLGRETVREVDPELAKTLTDSAAYVQSIRAAVIEECAKIAERKFAGTLTSNIGLLIADAIRALSPLKE